MTKQFKPIAMRCNQEQFESIKDELVKLGCNIYRIVSNWRESNYLVNNLSNTEMRISNVNHYFKSRYGRIIYETFDPEVFLDACGKKIIERKIIGYKRNPEMGVTALQLGKLLGCDSAEKNGLFFWGYAAQRSDFITRAQSLNIIGEDKILVPVYEEEENSKDLGLGARIEDRSSLLNPDNWKLNATQNQSAPPVKTYTLEQYNTFNEMQKLELNEFVLVHKSKVKP